MVVVPGARLGPCEIVAPIGAGGMGEVYRARDHKLGREVAIKLLPEQFSRDSERLSRFEREARLLASLNHPNIATLFALEEESGLQFLAMELVDGDTLAERMTRGALPVHDALPLLLQIAEGLQAAHERGVIHRDLKPANVKVTPEGTVKILDFGLAKAHAEETRGGVSSELSDSPTMARDTGEGVILGTVAYMSPEQARGAAVDKRTDIWSFGCVLYELLTGKRAFAGESLSDVLASVLKEEPDWHALPPGVPSSLQRILGRCLSKEPRERLRDVGEARVEIQAHIDHPREVETSNYPSRRPRWHALLPWTASVILGSSVLLLVLGRTNDAPNPRARIFTIDAPLETEARAAILSPDGDRLVIVAAEAAGSTALWIRELDSLELRRLPGTEDAAYPFWSPDSRSLGFFSGGRLKKTALSSGAVEELTEVISPRGGSWGNDAILYATGGNSDISRIDETGGAPSPATTRTDGENSHRYPSFLPDRRHFLYLARNPVKPERSGVWLASLDPEQAPRLLVASSSLAVYAEPGFLLYRRGENLLAQPLDPETLTLSGEPVSVADDVWFDPAFSGYANFSASKTGALAYRGGGIEKTELRWLDRDGNVMERLGEVGNYLNLYLSPDGRQVAVCRTNERTETRDLWVFDLVGGAERQLTFNPSSDFEPVWVDGRTIAFSSDRGGSFDIYETSSAGEGEVKTLRANDTQKWVRHASGDGAWVLYDESDQSTGNVNIVALNRHSGEAEPFRDTTNHDWFGRFSPDARWIAYTSNELGTHEVFVESFPRSGGRWKLSSGEGFQPVWHPAGDELFYLAPGGTLMSVKVQTKGDSLVHGRARPVLETGLSIGSVIQPDSLNHYDIAPDGTRFLTIRRANNPTSLTVMLDWHSGLAE